MKHLMSTSILFLPTINSLRPTVRILITAIFEKAISLKKITLAVKTNMANHVKGKSDNNKMINVMKSLQKGTNFFYHSKTKKYFVGPPNFLKDSSLANNIINYAHDTYLYTNKL